MSVRPILIHPDPRLKKVCEPVPAVDDALRKLIDDMFDTMYDAPGVGLAAPQVGVLRRVFVMDVSKDEAPPAPMALINPEIVWASEETRAHEEGCLSIPEIYEEIVRPARVRVRFLDREGAEREAEFDGLAATCAQHEIDHLNGKLFIDYLGAVKRQLITGKMKKLKRERLKA
ncbi:peptide deformylase [Oceanicella actignis]|uniref:Peptide deformylase n=1 Tax=Oceanicella actignis TaxID=1189325 RepID=A0A1M7SDY4_9RHOB|nr:peptide deformylase [Oceanicella actignis]TYO91358.1 peptide deformylase [Oceanicella actignis]SET24004.1 peptide deformylase [Oceanicella actignis]SHN56699.1 peptide deformylase [Oceanicella actignis]